jgi:hypothetical protein
MKWPGKKNGDLLGAMIWNEFDALVTADKSLYQQHKIEKYDIKIFLLKSPDNKYETLKALIPGIHSELKNWKFLNQDTIIE